MLIYVKSKCFKHTLSQEEKNKYPIWGKWNWVIEIIWTLLQGFRPCKAQTNLISYRDYNAEILSVASLSIILSWERTTEALIRLCGCVGWSAPLMFACSFVRFSLDTVHNLRPSDYEINQAGIIIIVQWLGRSIGDTRNKRYWKLHQ